GSKIILDVHDLMTTNYEAKFLGDNRSLIVKCLIFEQRVSAMFASHVICADHMQRAYLESTCKISNKKITVIMNFPDEEIFKPLRKINSDGKFRLIYHGTIAKRLGIDIMLEAISKIGDEIPVYLSIYGSGDFLTEALSISEKLGVGEKVYFSRSFFPVEMVPEIVSSMDLGIIANRKTLATDRFMMPVKLLEYVYLKIPVVAPRLKIIQSYFDEDMIEYYEPENVGELTRCIVKLYRDHKARKSLVMKASKFYEKQSWKIQEEEYLKLLSRFGRG
ncbi:MAG: glycosyltransferase, partial [bacterium]